MNTFRPLVHTEHRNYPQQPSQRRPVSYIDITVPRSTEHTEFDVPHTSTRPSPTRHASPTRPSPTRHASPTRPSPIRHASPTRPLSRPPPRPLSSAIEMHASQNSVHSTTLNRSPVKRTIRQILV